MILKLHYYSILFKILPWYLKQGLAFEFYHLFAVLQANSCYSLCPAFSIGNKSECLIFDPLKSKTALISMLYLFRGMPFISIQNLCNKSSGRFPAIFVFLTPLRSVQICQYSGSIYYILRRQKGSKFGPANTL